MENDSSNPLKRLNKPKPRTNGRSLIQARKYTRSCSSTSNVITPIVEGESKKLKRNKQTQSAIVAAPVMEQIPELPPLQPTNWYEPLNGIYRPSKVEKENNDLKMAYKQLRRHYSDMYRPSSPPPEKKLADWLLLPSSIL